MKVASKVLRWVSLALSCISFIPLLSYVVTGLLPALAMKIFGLDIINIFTIIIMVIMIIIFIILALPTLGMTLILIPLCVPLVGLPLWLLIFPLVHLALLVAATIFIIVSIVNSARGKPSVKIGVAMIAIAMLSGMGPIGVIAGAVQIAGAVINNRIAEKENVEYVIEEIVVEE